MGDAPLQVGRIVRSQAGSNMGAVNPFVVSRYTLFQIRVIVVSGDNRFVDGLVRRHPLIASLDLVLAFLLLRALGRLRSLSIILVLDLLLAFGLLVAFDRLRFLGRLRSLDLLRLGLLLVGSIPLRLTTSYLLRLPVIGVIGDVITGAMHRSGRYMAARS